MRVRASPLRELSTPLSSPDYWFFATEDGRQQGFSDASFFGARRQAVAFFGVCADALRLYYGPFSREKHPCS